MDRFRTDHLQGRDQRLLYEGRYSDFALNGPDRHVEGHPSQAQGDGLWYRDLIKTLEQTPVSAFVFSLTNLSHIRTLLCRQVVQYYASQQNPGVASYVAQILQPEGQSLREIALIMRSIYLEWAYHPIEMWSKDSVRQKQAIRAEVARLNQRFLTDQVPRVADRIGLQLAYQRDRTQQPMVMERPQLMSQAGTRLTRGVSDVWHN
jgi:hypothetical protein